MCNPISFWYRYVLLLLICCMEVAILYCVEILSGLQKTVINVIKINSLEYNILFSSYTWSIMVLSIIGSILIDRVIGRRTGMVISAFCSLSGVIVFVAAVIFRSYVFQVFGRVIMGFGMGCLDSVQSTFVSLWFKDKITFAMGFVSASDSLGAAIGLLLPRIIHDHLPSSLDGGIKLGLTFLTGVFVMLGLLFCSIAYVILHTRGIKFSAISPSAIQSNRISATDLKDFSLMFWLTSACSGVYFSAVFIYVANAQLLLISKYNFTVQKANSITFIIFASPLLFSPLIGYIVQNTGYNIYWSIFGTAIGMVSLILNNTVTKQQYFMPYIISILFAISYSLFGISLNPTPSMIVQEHQLATAYSIVNFIHSFIRLGTSVLGGIIIDNLGYTWLEVYFTFMMYTVLVTLVLTAAIDYSDDEVGDGKRVNKAGLWMQYLRSKCSSKNK